MGVSGVFESVEIEKVIVEKRVKAGACDGSCKEHKGVVALVKNKHFGYFSYCENAVNEDYKRGCSFKVFY